MISKALSLIIFLSFLPLQAQITIVGETIPSQNLASCRILSGPALYVGSQNLKPYSMEFRTICSDIDALREWNQFPLLNDSDFTAFEDVPAAGGMGNKGIFRAKYNGRSVIIKFSARSQELILNEARWLMKLNKAGRGAEFIGLYEANSAYGIVVEEHAGEPLSVARTPTRTRVTREMINDVLATGRLLHLMGVQYAPDMQFMLSEGRAYLIDPEYFSMRTPMVATIEGEFNPLQNAENLAQILIAKKRVQDIEFQNKGVPPPRTPTIIIYDR